jgi:hypothetical protein
MPDRLRSKICKMLDISMKLCSWHVRYTVPSFPGKTDENLEKSVKLIHALVKN